MKISINTFKKLYGKGFFATTPAQRMKKPKHKTPSISCGDTKLLSTIERLGRNQ